MHYFHVDAFSKNIFLGNPAVVFLVDHFPEKDNMQRLAGELNVSQTAFVKNIEGNRYHIRWFSPKDETPICGHATLASAHIIWEQTGLEAESIIFDSLAGPLYVTREDNKWVCLDFPIKPLTPWDMPVGFATLLGLENETSMVSFWRDEWIYVVKLESPELLLQLSPNFYEIAKLESRAVCVTAQNNGFFGGDIDYVSRYFAPKVGIYEDPVCGSSHCRLAPFWAQRLGRNQLVAYQASKRTGKLRLRVKKTENRVHILGQAITVAKAELTKEALEFLNK